MLLASIGLVSIALAPANGLAEDAELLRRALRELHPGRNRYRTEAEEVRAFGRLRLELESASGAPGVHAAFAKYLAGIQCGHTFLNPYNQSDEVRRELYEASDKLPFGFRWIGKEMVVTAASRGSGLQRGDRIRSLQDQTASALHDRLLPYFRADGGRDATRRHLMSIDDRTFCEVDPILPVIAPPRNGQYDLRVSGTGGTRSVRVRATSPRVRSAALGWTVEEDYDAAWTFRMEDGLGILRLPHFVTWRMKSDWKGFIRSAFDRVRAQPGSRLLIDLRGCEGGTTEPVLEIAQNTLMKPTTVRTFETRAAFRSVPEDLRPRLQTWDWNSLDFGARAVSRPEGGFTLPAETAGTFGPFEGAYAGPVTLAIDAANSSGGFLAAWLLKETGRFRLIGEETGGSRRGINAGQILFLELPHSKLKVDIPVFASFPLDPQPEQGVRPDIIVSVTAEDVRLNRDPVLAALRKQ
jgi:C-terminal processing protease CtpA/Prc